MTEPTPASHDEPEVASIVIQWKGTAACFDLFCPNCGAYTHYDVDMPFSGALECPRCTLVWIVSWLLPIHKADLVNDDDAWRVLAARTGHGVTIMQHDPNGIAVTRPVTFRAPIDTNGASPR